jgi:flagellar hook-associated protein 1 FlgK
MSISSLLGISQAAMLAQAQGVDIAGQNVANATTPGYVKRSVILTTRSDPGAPQGGVYASGVGRSWDAFAHGRVVTEGGRHGAASARSDALASVETLLSPGAGMSLADRTSAFFSAWSTLANNASDPTARAAVLAKATDLAQAISSTATGLSTARSDLLQQAVGVAGEVNERLAKIASLNEKIAGAQALGEGAPDLRDQRALLVREVGERMDVKSIEDASGKVTLLSSGSVLVDGKAASKVQVGVAATGDLAITLQRPSGVTLDITKATSSGTLGGLREARDSDIPALQAKLDKTAYDLAGAVNTVHSNAYALDGQTGRPLFKPPAQVKGAAYGFAIDPSVAGQPNKLAAAKDASDLPGGSDAAVAMAQLASAPLGAGGQSPADSFVGIAADVGVRKAAADSELTFRQATMGQADSLLESAGGVSVDEEMMNLTRYQRAFEASMRVVKTADELLSSIIKDL